MTAIDHIQSALSEGRVDAALHSFLELAASPDPGAHLRELGPRLATLYADFRTEPVEGFVQRVTDRLSEAQAAVLTQPLRADMELTAAWARRLADLAAERLANEVAERVKAGDMPGAEATALGLIMTATTPEGRAGRARQVGGILGGLLYEKERATALVRAISRAPQKFGIDGVAATDVEEEFQRAQVAAVRRERSVAALARQELTQVTVELSRALPGRMAIHDPRPEDFEAFNAQARAMFRAALASHGHENLHEVTLLLVEFVPREVSTAGALAGVEQRLYPTLGRTARTVAGRVLQDVGAHPRVFAAYMAFAQDHAKDRIAPATVEALGLLRNPHATDHLVRVASDRRNPAHHEAMLALGSLGGPVAEKTLVSLLAGSVGGRTIEGEMRRDAVVLISALGRLVRSMPAEHRATAIGHALKAVPSRDTELVIRAVLNFFTGNPETFNPAQLKWAAQVATMALWTVDRPELARAARNAPLGFRQPLIDLLERLAPLAMDTINETVLASAKTYNGAYLAVGELYAKVPHPSQLPVLRQLLLNTFLHDESTKNAYNRETVLDTATEQQTELGKDKVLGSLVFAVDKIGGDEASGILADLFRQVQAGQLPNPGREATDILFAAFTRTGAGQAAMKGPQSPSETPTGGVMIGGTAPAAAANPEEVLQLIRDLGASYLLASKRRTKKVSAMAELARHKAVAALPALIAHVADKDPVIAGAALTALTDFAAPPIQPPVLKHYLDEMIHALTEGTDATRDRIADVLRRQNPRRSPLKDRLEEVARRPGIPPGVRATVAALLEAPRQAGQAEQRESAQVAETAPTAENLQISRLDRLRAYNQERQDWIRGGKRGPEPKRPDGL